MVWLSFLRKVNISGSIMGVKTHLSPGSGPGIIWLMRFVESVTIQSPGYIMGFSVKII